MAPGERGLWRPAEARRNPFIGIVRVGRGALRQAHSNGNLISSLGPPVATPADFQDVPRVAAASSHLAFGLAIQPVLHPTDAMPAL